MSGANPDHSPDSGRQGWARMVDVSARDLSVRDAVATGRVVTTAEVMRAVATGRVPKGDVPAVARVAGILAAKQTPHLIPLCHPIALHGVDVTVNTLSNAIEITARTRAADRTGVEMEALAAVAVAGLAVIDMIKAMDPFATLTDVRVEDKAGGQSGPWHRSDQR